MVKFCQVVVTIERFFLTLENRQPLSRFSGDRVLSIGNSVATMQSDPIVPVFTSEQASDDRIRSERLREPC
jgi:hypothetical protein